MNHFFLEGRNLTQLAAGAHDQFQFVGRVHRPLAQLPRAKYLQHRASRPAHHENQGPRQGEKNVHGGGHREGDLLGSLQGQGLRNQLAQDHVQAGNQDEGNEDGGAVGIDHHVGHIAHPTLHDLGEQRLPDPAQGQTHHRDA